MTDRSIRNLAHLRRSASTARVLNLLQVWEANGPGEGGLPRDPAWAERPLFQTPALNRAMIIKHRLRRDEIDLFPGRRHVATKIVIPIDASDLKAGGRFVFVNQYTFDRSMAETFGIRSNHPDMAALRLIDALPSLDPFLLREQLRRGGYDPAGCYFSISEGDLRRMFRFVERELEPLVTLSIGPDTDAVAVGLAGKLAGKILSNTMGEQLDALRDTLRLAPEQYEEGVFCWKGFLYYKWMLTTLLGQVADVADQVLTVTPGGRLDKASRHYIERGRGVLRERIARTCDEVTATLKVYDNAYLRLIQFGEPTAFRDFLLAAPAMFSRLGDQLGAIQHIVTFWGFRFRPGAAPVQGEELIDIFMDFETGLLGRGETVPDPETLLAA